MKFLFYSFLCFVLLESSGGFTEAPDAFIFSLTNSGGLVPFVSKVTPRFKTHAIDRKAFYGPKFGQDLIISLRNAGRIQNSKARLGTAYAVPAANQVLARPDSFLPDEVEVFYLDPSR